MAQQILEYAEGFAPDKLKARIMSAQEDVSRILSNTDDLLLRFSPPQTKEESEEITYKAMGFGILRMIGQLPQSETALPHITSILYLMLTFGVKVSHEHFERYSGLTGDRGQEVFFNGNLTKASQRLHELYQADLISLPLGQRKNNYAYMGTRYPIIDFSVLLLDLIHEAGDDSTEDAIVLLSKKLHIPCDKAEAILSGRSPFTQMDGKRFLRAYGITNSDIVDHFTQKLQRGLKGVY